MQEAARKALEVLRAIQNQFVEGADVVYADALLFADESTLEDHVDAAILALEEAK